MGGGGVLRFFKLSEWGWGRGCSTMCVCVCVCVGGVTWYLECISDVQCTYNFRD